MKLGVFIVWLLIFSSLVFGVRHCGGSHCHFWGPDPYNGNEPTPNVTMNLVFKPSAIQLQTTKETYIVKPGTELYLENINTFVLNCIDGASKDKPIAVRVLEKRGDEFVETSGNYSVKNYEVCRCDGPRNAVTGDTTSFKAFTFSTKGIYTLQIQYQLTTNAMSWGTYKEIDVIVGPSDVEVQGPDKQVFGLENNVYEVQSSAKKSMRWRINNKGPLDIKLLSATDLDCAGSLRENCSFPDLERSGNEINIKAGETYFLLEEFTAKLPSSSPQTTQAGLNIRFTDITGLEYDLAKGLKAVDVSVSFTPYAFAIYPYKKTGSFVVNGGQEYTVQVCTDSPYNELYELPAFTATIYDERGTIVATAGFHSINNCANANDLQALNTEGGLTRFSVPGSEQKTYTYEVVGMVGVEGSYKSDFVRIAPSSEFDETSQFVKKENAIVDTSLGPQKIVPSLPQTSFIGKVNFLERTKEVGYFSPQFSESPDFSSPITYALKDVSIESPEGTFKNTGPVKRFVGGKTEVFVVQQQGGFKAYAKTGYAEDETLQLAKYDLKLLWTDREKFMLGINSAYAGLCRNLEGDLIKNQNDFAFTGPNASPNVYYEWSPDKINENTCSEKACDSTQFMMALLKRLQSIEQLALDNKLQEANSKTSFQAYLVEDGFSVDFQKDWDKYYSEKFFSLNRSYIDKWKKYFSGETSEQRLIFKRDGSTGAGRAIHEAALYRVFLGIDFKEENWRFFDALGNPKATITVNIEKIRDLEPNLLYKLPFDAELGLQEDEKYLRKGYGLGYIGDEMFVNSEIASYSVKTRNTKTESMPVAWLDIRVRNNFLDVQKNSAGNLLNISSSDKPKTYNLIFSPSTPFPAILLAEKETDKDFMAVSYSIYDSTRGNINAGNYFAKLVETAYKPENANIQCTDPENNATLPVSIPLDREKSTNLLLPWCSTQPNANVSEKIYGFTKQKAGKMLLETIFYPNTEGLIIKNQCLNAGKIYVAKLDSEGNIVGFTEIRNNTQYTFEIPTNKIDSFEEAISQIAKERACIINSNVRSGNTLVPIATGLWWNESKLTKDLRAKVGNNAGGIQANACYNL